MSSTINKAGTANDIAAPIKATSSPLIEDMSSTQLEDLLYTTFLSARKLAWESEEATPEALTAMLAMYAIQEVHACGYRPRSAIRAMVMKVKADEKISTIGCLKTAKRELIREFKEKRGEVYEKPKPDGRKEGPDDQGEEIAGVAGVADGKA